MPRRAAKAGQQQALLTSVFRPTYPEYKLMLERTTDARSSGFFPCKKLSTRQRATAPNKKPHHYSTAPTLPLTHSAA